MQILQKHWCSANFFRQKSYKCLIGYKDDDRKINALKTSAYVKSYDGETIWMHFPIEDGELLEKYNDIWEKVSISV